MPSAEAALTCERLSVSYAGRSVLHDVTLSVPYGSALALVGPNGAGKSTLIKSVLGLVETRGAIRVLDRDPARARPEVAYVPQADTLDPSFPITAGEVVLMGRYRSIGWFRRPREGDRRIAAAALDQVGLSARSGDRFGTLSMGQRQRVLLARAIAAAPRLLLLDESFNGVDAASQDAIVETLLGLRAAGTTMVIATHDLPLARRACDLACLINCTVRALGAIDEVLEPGRLYHAMAS
ncbi:metal ABC transporter ATP-binding protein [Nonomuraea aridisoli]|uniref:ABC transporter ATP-binding protein n=1 Tax=Nonomuraea aridisoli TaxID=2070368 RepID=A0A2W2E9P3_9ACTN|nr:ABC transporter ATP-binding protein [Nonomuraea aridisoli]PZG21016.1 ABC transporter ATP-binding protein [Nonomuraea aridisoli]